MEKVYYIKTNHGYSYLMELGLTNKVFKTKERCDEIISEIAESKYGKPFYHESSEFVKIVKQYWAGDFAMEDAKEKLGSKQVVKLAFDSALYYDFKNMFWIEEYEISE